MRYLLDTCVISDFIQLVSSVFFEVSIMTQIAPNPTPESATSGSPQQPSLPVSPQSNADPKPKFDRRLPIPIGLAAAAIGYGVWLILPRPAETVLHISGRLESDETDIGAKTGGRIVKILVREGEADLNLQQSKGDSSGRVEQAQSNVSAAEADLLQAKAQVEQAKAQVQQSKSELRFAQLERDRYVKLVAEGAVNQQLLDQKQTTLDTTKASLNTAKAKLVASQAAVKSQVDRLAAASGSLTQVRSTGLNPEIRTAQLDASSQQKTQAQAKLAAAQAKVKNAQASRDQIQRRLESFKVRSPIDGIVQDRPLEPGAVVSAGKTLLTVLDPSAVYLRGYIPEGDIGKIRVSQTARVLLDSSPNQPFSARVSQIDTKASFTPENIYFKQDRVKQVFGIKLSIDKPEGFAKLGMPADAEIDLGL